MQSSYSLIKRDCALDGDKIKITTNYVVPKKEGFNELNDECLEAKEDEKILSLEELKKLSKQYEELGKRIIDDANNEKQGIILRATMQAQLLEKEAYKKGYDEGIKNGHEDGYEAGYKKAFDENIDEAKAKSKDIIETAEKLLSTANENYANYLEEKKSDVIRLSLEIAQDVLKKEVIEHTDSMNLLIEQAIEISKGEKNIIIKCNSTHVNDIEEQIQRWKVSYSISDEIFILNDDFMEPGNAIVEKPSGKVVVGIDIGLEMIKKEILG